VTGTPKEGKGENGFGNHPIFSREKSGTYTGKGTPRKTTKQFPYEQSLDVGSTDISIRFARKVPLTYKKTMKMKAVMRICATCMVLM
jgi:hypothetical protein